MVGKIIKEITKKDKAIYDVLGDRVYPLELPETDELITPSAIYSIVGTKKSNKLGNKVYDIAVYFLVMTEKYSELQSIIKNVIKGMESSNWLIGELDGIRINYVNITDSQDLLNDKNKNLCGNEMIFNFNITIEQ